MKKLICAILCAAMLAALCACGEAPAKPDPVAAVKSAIEIMHYDNYGDIYSALKKARERTPSYGYAAKFTMADTAVENAAVGTAGAAADSAAAPTTPGARCRNEGMALKRCVTCVAPAAIAALACE